MQGIINFFRGHVTVTVVGVFPERFLNLCGQNGVEFWGMEWVDSYTITLHTPKTQLPHLRQLAGRVGCEVTVAGRQGVPFFLRRFRRRYALIAGLAVAILLSTTLSRYVLTIEVTGNETVPTAVILTELQRLGLRRGVYGPDLEVRAMSQQMLLAVPELSWLTVNLHGTRAEVIVREALPKPAIQDETTPTHVVADADGIITGLSCIEGQRLFQVGQAVVAGEIVISGVMELREPEYGDVDAGQRWVHARGDIYATTNRVLEGQIPLTAEVKGYTGEVETDYRLFIFNSPVNFLGNSGISMAKCDKIVETHALTLPWGTTLPIALEASHYRGYTTEAVPLNQAAAQQLVETALLERLQRAVGDGTIDETNFEAKIENHILTVTLRAQCSEEIGVEVSF